MRALVGDFVPPGERLDPLELVVVRFLPVALCCLAWFALLPGARQAARGILMERPGLVLLLGLLNVWGYNLAFGAGHQRVPAGTGSLITALNPVLTFAIAAVVRLERATVRKALGLAVALAGIYGVVVYGAGRAVEPAYLRDALLLAGAPMSWALYTVLSKPLLARHSPVHLSLLIVGLAALPTLPIAIGLPALHAKVALWGPERHAAALFLAIFCTLIGFWLWYEGLRRLPASTAAAFVFLNPPLAILFEWLWFGRRPQVGLLAGGALVLAGVWLCSRGGARRPSPS